jgi:hypothetical protein
MKKQGNQNSSNPTTDRRMVRVAVRITPETVNELRDLYADQEEKITIRMVKIGEWRYPCAIYFLPEDEVKGFKRLQQTEAKREQREARCWLPDGSGGFIRCDADKHKCSECDRWKSFSFDNCHPTSYEALQDFYGDQEEELYLAGEDIPEMKDPSIETAEPQQEEAYTEIMQILVDRLTAIKPKYGAIFQELLKGNLQPLNIAKALGLGKTQMYETVPKVQELAKKLYYELQNK